MIMMMGPPSDVLAGEDRKTLAFYDMLMAWLGDEVGGQSERVAFQSDGRLREK